MDDLPALSPFIKIFPANNHFNGEPQWIIHCPGANNFFKIGWKAFQIIGRLHHHKTVETLKQSIYAETGHNFSDEDIAEAINFIKQNGLVDGPTDIKKGPEKKSLLASLMHGYLYFTIPLIKPQKFLEKTYPYLRPLLNHYSMIASAILLLIGIIMTIPRIDEFLHSFTSFFSIEGAIILGTCFMVVKIIHEFAHAFIATKYNVKVPHMGVAFIILYPVLYTDATDSWRLKSKNQRIHIGLAGVYAEVILASIALIGWHYTEPGLLQMTLFSIVMISLVGSLLINLNPLMRFDGYFVLSDYWGIENLHTAAIDHARCHIRKFLWGWNTLLSYDYPASTMRTLTLFGYAVMIYRFFLFLGIAIIVYHVFFPPLGLIAMMFELYWFIGLPIYREIKIWWQNKSVITETLHGKITLTLAAVIIIACFIPFNGRLSAPAVIHAENYRAFYPTDAAYIESIFVKNNQLVREGDLLMELSSPNLEKEILLGEKKLLNLEKSKRREQTNIELFRKRQTSIDDEITTIKVDLKNLYEKQGNLIFTAPFDGVISSLDPEIHKNRFVHQDQLLMRLIAKDKNQIIQAYVPEKDIDFFAVGDFASFRLNHALLANSRGVVQHISPVPIENLTFPSLASIYKGPIGVLPEKDRLKPITPYYSVEIKLTASYQNNNDLNFNKILPGHVIIHGHHQSFAQSILNFIMTLYRENVTLN